MIKKHFICEECDFESIITEDNEIDKISYEYQLWTCPFCDEYHYNQEMLDDSE